VRVEELLRILPAVAGNQARPANDTGAQAIAQMAAAGETAATDFTNNVRSWFDSAMDRVSQRFALQMRIWTVVFSLVLAFGAHLDVFRLYTQLSSDAELRAKLAGSADAITRQAAGMLPPQAGGNGVNLSVVPGIFSAGYFFAGVMSVTGRSQWPSRISNRRCSSRW
jgi:hypothetical protein